MVTVCPTGIAHTYMAAGKLAQAAASRGVDVKVETQGWIGAENVLGDNDVSTGGSGFSAAVDKDMELAVSWASGLAPVHTSDGLPAVSVWGGDKERSVREQTLMNGVSYVIPSVVVDGLLIAISLSLSGHTAPSGGLVTRGTASRGIQTEANTAPAAAADADVTAEPPREVLYGYLTEEREGRPRCPGQGGGRAGDGGVARPYRHGGGRGRAGRDRLAAGGAGDDRARGGDSEPARQVSDAVTAPVVGVRTVGRGRRVGLAGR